MSEYTCVDCQSFDAIPVRGVIFYRCNAFVRRGLRQSIRSRLPVLTLSGKRPTMSHKIEVGGYTETHCASCPLRRWKAGKRGYCEGYKANLVCDYPSRLYRHPACIADEKAQREAAPGTTPVEVVVRERETK